jgi:hypothetical protein
MPISSLLRALLPQEISIQTIRLKNIKPSVFIATLEKKPTGIDQLLPDDPKMRLTVRGNKDDVDAFAQLVLLADVKPLRFVLSVSLVRFSAEGRREGILEKKSALIENQKIQIIALGLLYDVALMPHNAASGIRVDITVRAHQAIATKEPQIILGEASQKRLAFGKVAQLVSFFVKGDAKTPPGVLAIEVTASPEK